MLGRATTPVRAVAGGGRAHRAKKCAPDCCCCVLFCFAASGNCEGMTKPQKEANVNTVAKATGLREGLLDLTMSKGECPYCTASNLLSKICRSNPTGDKEDVFTATLEFTWSVQVTRYEGCQVTASLLSSFPPFLRPSVPPFLLHVICCNAMQYCKTCGLACLRRRHSGGAGRGCRQTHKHKQATLYPVCF